MNTSSTTTAPPTPMNRPAAIEHDYAPPRPGAVPARRSCAPTRNRSRGMCPRAPTADDRGCGTTTSLCDDKDNNGGVVSFSISHAPPPLSPPSFYEASVFRRASLEGGAYCRTFWGAGAERCQSREGMRVLVFLLLRFSVHLFLFFF